MRSAQLVVVASLVLLGAVSCSISTSLSESSSSPFEWVSESSGSISGSSGGGDNAYRQDVSDVTLAFATTGGDVDAFRARIATLATQRGVTSWEEDAPTCASIGEGVRRAKLDQVAALDFGEHLFGENAASLAAYRGGYATVR